MRVLIFVIFLISTLLMLTSTLVSNELDNFTAAVWESPNGGRFNYRHRAPDKVESNKKYPILVMLHGAGGRSKDNKKQLLDADAIDALAKHGVSSTFESYIFAGQVPPGQQWVDVKWNTLEHKMPEISDSMRMLFESLDVFIKKNQVDTSRIYVLGLSMGGYGTWDAIQRRPDFFAAAVPICGGGDKSMAKDIAQVPVWVFHGEKDPVIDVSRSRDMVNSMKAAGGNPKYTEVKGRGHNSHVDVWNNSEVWKWLYHQKK